MRAQAFDVIVSTPPLIQQGFKSIKGATGLYVALNCSITGNPMPNIQWFKNGKRLQFNSIIYYRESQLIINTADEEYKGIYQCLATNIDGEAQVIGQITWENKSVIKRPENVKCYPINYSTMKITFDTQQKVHCHLQRKNNFSLI